MILNNKQIVFIHILYCQYMTNENNVKRKLKRLDLGSMNLDDSGKKDNTD